MYYAIKDWRKSIGPKTIVPAYAKDPTVSWALLSVLVIMLIVILEQLIWVAIGTAIKRKVTRYVYLKREVLDMYILY